ncbi:MAG: putative zinc-binding metallopeptidase [Methylobacteriaceae bacterium]|nr:putative zinc-binding metallopeptidase [Methylobacteriaceae bacterium]
MRQFRCPNCGQRVYFENYFCERCATPLSFDARQMTMVAQAGAHDCVNRQHLACNWAVDSDASDFCLACRLNRTVPNLSEPGNLVRWQKIESAKHRMIYDLLRLGLPVKSRAEDPSHGIAFDFLSEYPGAKVLTGHDEGKITLNIAEADDAEREARRAQMHEPYRTLVGHFRHEIGHHYWDILLRGSPDLPAFQALFGDERADYTEALQRHYENGPPQGWRQSYISAYATSHPWEDWAECFAHFIHIVATLDTAADLPLGLGRLSGRALQDSYREDDFDALLKAWVPLTEAVNEINRSMGVSDVYPFVLTPSVIGKLHFVHMIVRKAARAAEQRGEVAVERARVSA